VVEGRVSDPTDTRYLDGADVRIVELGRVAQTSSGGAFRFVDVQPGAYTLLVSFAGAEPTQTRIEVPAEGLNVNVTLNAYAGGGEQTVLVVGQRASLASSLSLQRSSDTVDSVLTRDGIGQFPDQNVAEAIRRASGVNVLNDQGEGRFVSVRGLDPNLNAASINGVRVPAPESDIRSVALDVIPSELIESIEIKKSLTPDMDADSLGGSIEINTTSAFDRREPLLALRAEGAYNDLADAWSPRYSVDFSRTFDGRLGVAGGLSWNKRTFATDNVEPDGWDEDGGVVYADAVEYRDYDVERTRLGASLSLDYQLNDATALYARGLYSLFEDQEFRGRLVFEFDEPPTSGTANSATFASADGRIRVERDMKDRFEEQEIASLVVGGETRLDRWSFDYQASWSEASELENGSVDPVVFRRDFEDPGELGVTFDYSDYRLPRFTIGAGSVGFLNPATYEFNDVEVTTLSDSQDQETSFRFDATRTFVLDGGDLDLSFGAKRRDREKSFDAEVDFYETDADLTLAGFLGRQSYGLLNIEPQASQTAFSSFFRRNFASFERQDLDSDFDSAASDYELEEDITAGYVMGRYDTGRTRLIGGVRVERTEQDVSALLVELVEEGGTRNGVELDEDTLFFTPTGFEREYTDWLPSLNLRYEATDDVLLRAGVYRTVLRPTPGQIAPRFLIEENDEGEREGELGNPGLDPYRGWNLDLSAEWYFGRNAVLQGGVFYKEIEDFIVVIAADGGPDDPFRGVFNGIVYDEAEIPINGDTATVFGVELGYQQALDFLPGLLGGFVLGANYTYTDAEGDVNGRTINLPAASKHTANLVIGYDRGPFDLRFAASYRDKYLDELGGSPEEDRLVEDHVQYDFTAKYDFNDRIQFFGELVNIGDEPFVAYQSGPRSKRLLQYEEYSWTGKLGVRVRY
jgi:TonB-dependent receptor